jgi:type I restriction enzyme S subunit
LIPSNSVLIVNRSGILKHTLPVGITRRSVAINQDLKALICNGRSHPEYIAHMVKAAEPIVLKWVRATTADNFSIEHLRSLEIPFPSLDEQRRIAAILDKADALRRKRKLAIRLFNELGTALSRTYLHAGKTIELGTAIISGPTNGLYKPSVAYGEGAQIVRINNFYHGRIIDVASLKRLQLDDKELSRFQLSVGDILINRVNSLEYLGKSALVEAVAEPIVYESNMMRFSVDRSVILPEVCIALLQTPEIKHQVLSKAKKAVNQASINQKDVRSLRLRLPPMDRQEKFVEVLRKIATELRIILLNQQSIESLFSSLQHRAFSGRL